MERTQMWGALVGGLWLFGLLVIGVYVTHIPYYGEQYDLKGFGPLAPTDKPEFMQDQIFARKISKITRGLKDDFDSMRIKYRNLPPFNPPENDLLSAGQVERYITAVKSYTSEFDKFHQRTMKGRPGFYRMVATVGMIGGFHKVTKRRALIKGQMREEEFEWVVKRLVKAILYCVNYKLENDMDMEKDVKKHLERIQERGYDYLGLKEYTAPNEYFLHHEKFKANEVPRTNIRLFLENYPDIRYSGINFRDPVEIHFDKEAILKSAANNPP